MPSGNKNLRDAHSAISLCLSALRHPHPSPGGHLRGEGATDGAPQPSPFRGKQRNGAGKEDGAEPGGEGHAGLRVETLRRGVALQTPGGPRGRRSGGRGAASGPAAAGEAPATHVLRVPLVHRRQWRPGRHFVRAAGSGRGLAGRAGPGLAAGPGGERQGLRPLRAKPGPGRGERLPQAAGGATSGRGGERGGQRTRRKRRGSRFPRRRRRGTRAGPREGSGRGRLPGAGRAAGPAGRDAEAGRRGGSRSGAVGGRCPAPLGSPAHGRRRSGAANHCLARPAERSREPGAAALTAPP